MKTLLKIIITLIVLICIGVVWSIFLIQDAKGVPMEKNNYAKNVTKQILNNPLERLLVFKTVVTGMEGDVITTESYVLGLIDYATVDVIYDKGAVVTWRKWFGDYEKVDTINFRTERPDEEILNAREAVTFSRNDAVIDYIKTQNDFVWLTEDDGQKFCVYENLNPENVLFPMYLWVRCSEYVVRDGELEEASGSYIPAKIDYPNELSYYDITKFSHTIPGSGSDYGKDIQKIFPKNVQVNLSNHNIELLNSQLEELAKEELLR